MGTLIRLRRFLLTLVLASLLPAAPAVAQATGSIQGSVVDASTQRPLTGAQLFIVGTSLGTLSNNDGRFILTNVPAGTHTLRVQLIGYAQQDRSVTVQAGQPAMVNFELGQSAIALDELVVTGQGRARQRRELSTSVDVLNASQLELSPAVSLDQMLQGRVSGATVNATSAQPGTAGLINFRGVSSVFGSQTPVIYVDGVRVDNSMSTAMGTGGEQSSALADLLASDIERVEITKGGAASTLYGSDAATGVIQIFTKKGAPGTARITARIEQGFDQPELKYMLGTNVIFPAEDWEGVLPDEELQGDFLRRNFFRTGHHQNYSVSVQGGQSEFTYNVSGRVQDGEGVQPKNDNQLFSLRGGIQARVSETLGLDFTGNYTRNQFGRLFNGTAIADPLTSFEVGDALWFSGTSTLTDAMEQFLMPDISEEVSRFLFSTALRYTPSDIFQGRVQVGLDRRSSLNRISQPIGYVVASPSDGEGAIYRYNRDFNSVSLEAAGSLTYPVRDVWSNTFTFGVQGFRDDLTTVFARGFGFALPGAPEVDQAGDIFASETNSELFNGGLFFEDQLGLWDRLFLSAGVRIDANTAFGEEVSTKAYPKLGASYLISEEPFFQNLTRDAVSDLKLRIAYGQTGKFPPPFLRDRTYNAVSFRGGSAPRFSNPGNPDLGPEVTKTVELGFDAGLLRERLGLNVTWFDAVTDDALFRVPEPPVTGLGTQVRNVGQISNRGWELGGNALIVNRPDTRVRLHATYNTVDNKVESMGPEGAAAAPFWLGGSYQRICGPPNDCIDDPERPDVHEKLPVGAWLVDTPIDTNGDGLLDDTQPFFLCSDGSVGMRMTAEGPVEQACSRYATPTPSHNGSFGADVTLFDRLTLTALADWATGFWVHDWGSMWATYNVIYRRELVESDYTYPTQYTADGEELGRYNIYDAISEFMLPGDYLKLRELGTRYVLPDAWSGSLGAERGSIYLSVRNVGIWSKNGLVDPELNGVSTNEALQLGGQNSITLSPPRMFRFGVEFSF